MIKLIEIILGIVLVVLSPMFFVTTISDEYVDNGQPIDYINYHDDYDSIKFNKWYFNQLKLENGSN
jgi:hypothetical protein